VTETELAAFFSRRTADEWIARWLAVDEMASALGVEAAFIDIEIEGKITDRKLEVGTILAPHMKAGARTWGEIHDALSPEEHDQVEALMSETRA
jgi:hypothetical protein